MSYQSFRERLKLNFPIFRDMFRRTKPLIRTTIVAGGTAGDLTISGLDKDDELCGVLDITNGVDYFSEFSVVGNETINNAGGTDTTGASLIVTWLTWGNPNPTL